MENYKLNETKIGNANVIVDILPTGKCIPGVKIKATSITIHNTGNLNANAKANHNYMKNINKSGERIASWHFTVDDTSIYQAEATNYKCYHAGCTSGNATSIGIEICMFSDASRQKQAYLNAIELVKILMKYHGFSTSQVKRHYDWTRKHCPEFLIEGKYGYTWSWFKNQLTSTSSAPSTNNSTESKPSTTLTGKYIVRYLQQVLNDDYNCGLDVDGYFGNLTQAAVKKHYLQKGDKGSHVTWLQKALVNRGFKIDVDGSFGPATLNAVKQYQAKKGLVADGYAGLDTHKAIIND